MIEETLAEKKRQTNDASWLDSINVSLQFKSSCISAIISAIYSETKRDIRFGNEDPMTIIVWECAAFSGNTVSDPIIDSRTLTKLLKSIDGILFIETLEDVCFKIYEKDYCYCEFEQSLNVLLKRYSMPFKCNKGQFIDSLEVTMYDEIVAPCLSVLEDNGFETADGHLRESFKKYHENENKEAILKCGLALDSVLDKIILDKGITTAKSQNDFNEKITLLRDAGLLPDFQDKKFNDHLKELLHMPLKIRNNEPNVSHGRADDCLTDDDLVKYTIDLTAASIL